MNNKIPSGLLFLALALLMTIFLSACSSFDPGNTATGNAEFSTLQSSANGAYPGESSQDISSTSSNDTVSFQGLVFVASTELHASLWKKAGWRIGDQPLDTDAQEVPTDCTLYPHQGVENQWVGRCAGNVLIPNEGADHIAVMLTDPDGSTTMVQISP